MTNYGRPHQKLRARLLRAMRDGDPCCRCGAPMWRDDAIDLDHDDDDRSQYRGLAHSRCNCRAGAILGNSQRSEPTWHARDW